MVGKSLTLTEIENKCISSNVEFLKKAQYYDTIFKRRNEEGFFQLLGITLSKIAALGGINTGMDSLIKSDIANMLFTSFNELSIDEIYFAFQKERYGEYEERTKHFNLFNTEYVSEVLKKYIVWKRSKRIEHNITKESVPLLPEMSEVQKKKIAYDSLCATYDRIKNDGFDEMAWLIYDRIKNKITLSAEERKNIYKQEEVKYINELKTSGDKSDYQKAIGFSKHEQTGRYNSAVQTQCKNRMVLEFVAPHLATLETFLKAIGYED